VRDLRLASILGIAVLGGTVLAHDVVPMSYSEMVKTSEIIAVGTVTQSVSRVDDGGRTIRTYVTVQQLAVQKGRVDGSSLTLRLEGGKVGDEVLKVSCMPELKVGSRYLMFIHGNGKHLSPFTGYCQGVFEIASAGGREVLKGHDGLELIGLQNDRLVFALPPRPKSLAPELVADPAFKAVAGHPNADQLEMDALRRLQQTPDSKGPRQAPTPAGFKPVEAKLDIASPPPAVADPKAPVRDLPAPVYVPSTEDTGHRVTVATLLTNAREVR
jgi:hypothetical protein